MALWSWGNNEALLESPEVSTSNHQFMPGETYYSGPQEIPNLPELDSVIVYSDSDTKSPSVYAITPDGNLFVWGINLAGRLGDGSGSFVRSRPLRLSTISDVKAVCGGFTSTYALKADGQVWAWGTFREAREWPIIPDYATPKPVTGLDGIISITKPVEGLGSRLAALYAIRANGSVLAWRPTGDDPLGDGEVKQVTFPKAAKIRSIVGGDDSAFAICFDGTVWGWGKNDCGQLGDGSTSDREDPVQVGGLSNVSTVAVGWGRTFAVCEDGSVWAWGANSDSPGFFGSGHQITGLLGIGDAADQSRCVRVEGLPAIQEIVVAGRSVLALARNGDVWAWGDNSEGTLGIGTTANQSKPVQVIGLTDVKALISDYSSLYALKQDGTVWAWGGNWQGKLGDGTDTSRFSPVQVSGLVGVRSLSVAGSAVLALVPDVPEIGTASFNGFKHQEPNKPIADLAQAAAAGNENAVRRILETGTDPGVIGMDGDTALVHAARSGHINVVQVLLNSGADANQRGRHESPLIAATLTGYADVVRVLVTNGALADGRFEGRTALMMAAQQGDQVLVRALIDCGAEIDASDEENHTSLYMAAEVGQLHVVELLLQLGASPDGVGTINESPLRIAAETLNNAVALTLLRAGADSAAMYRNGRAISFYNQDNGHAFAAPDWTVGQLLRRTDLFVADTSTVPPSYWDGSQLINGKTPLMFWAANGIVDEVQSLLNAGADPNATDDDGDDAQSYAMGPQNTEILEMLLEYGADPNARSTLLGQPSTILHVAAASGWCEGVEALVANGARVDERAMGGVTPLMLASGAGHENCLAALYRLGADLHAVDQDGDSALFYARSRGRTSTAELLHRYRSESTYSNPSSPPETQRKDNPAAAASAVPPTLGTVAEPRSAVEVMRSNQSGVFDPLLIRVFWNGAEIGALRKGERLRFAIQGNGEARFRSAFRSSKLAVKAADGVTFILLSGGRVHYSSSE
ncbi:ankyrin repeat domain-containing protein [Arthrobacter sp. zg-Y40]|uniref:ankyrin repeat domain-containing protein n=1 Tax=Arthrobacter sp. zg-Y40 TaxID=2886939 RepID=UPI002F3E3975